VSLTSRPPTALKSSFQRASDGQAVSPGRTLTNGVASPTAAGRAAPLKKVRPLAAAAFSNVRLSMSTLV
jgi:hypothetical protein